MGESRIVQTSCENGQDWSNLLGEMAGLIKLSAGFLWKRVGLVKLSVGEGKIGQTFCGRG